MRQRLMIYFICEFKGDILILEWTVNYIIVDLVELSVIVFLILYITHIPSFKGDKGLHIFLSEF